MVEFHGSQCGFCTPGFITSMVAASINGDKDHETTLAGNLCRCTGYEPIIKAAIAAENEKKPSWVEEDFQKLAELRKSESKKLPKSKIYFTTSGHKIEKEDKDILLKIFKKL